MQRATMWSGVLGAALLNVAAPALGAPARSLSCLASADCAAGLECVTHSYETCQGQDPACTPGSACGDKRETPEQTNCAAHVEGTCTPRWALPCQLDADCGAGFRCAEQLDTWCRGMGSTGNGTTPPEFSEVCGVTGGRFACELVQRDCSGDTDCSGGFSCQQADLVTVCGAPSREDILDAGPDRCSLLSPRLCAPAGYFPLREDTKGQDGGLATVDTAEGDDGADAGAGGLATEDARMDSGPAGDGCSLAPGKHAGAHPGLFAAGLLAALARRRKRAVAR